MHARVFGGNKLTWTSLSSTFTKKIGSKQKKLKCNAMQSLLNIPFYAERLTTEMDVVDMMYTISG